MALIKYIKTMINTVRDLNGRLLTYCLTPVLLPSGTKFQLSSNIDSHLFIRKPGLGNVNANEYVLWARNVILELPFITLLHLDCYQLYLQFAVAQKKTLWPVIISDRTRFAGGLGLCLYFWTWS